MSASYRSRSSALMTRRLSAAPRAANRRDRCRVAAASDHHLGRGTGGRGRRRAPLPGQVDARRGPAGRRVRRGRAGGRPGLCPGGRRVGQGREREAAEAVGPDVRAGGVDRRPAGRRPGGGQVPRRGRPRRRRPRPRDPPERLLRTGRLGRRPAAARRDVRRGLAPRPEGRRRALLRRSLTSRGRRRDGRRRLGDEHAREPVQLRVRPRRDHELDRRAGAGHAREPVRPAPLPSERGRRDAR